MLDSKPCECCGRTRVAIGYWDICPICGWEDDEFQCEDPDLEGGANEMSLNQYRKWYQEKIKNNPEYTWQNEIINNFKTKKINVKLRKIEKRH